MGKDASLTISISHSTSPAAGEAAFKATQADVTGLNSATVYGLVAETPNCAEGRRPERCRRSERRCCA